MTNTKKAALEIACAAADAGATAEMIRTYDLTAEDCEYLAAEYELSDNWELAAVEEHIRESGLGE